MPPREMAYIDMYLSAREVFGQEADASFVLSRVGTYGWKPSLTRLAQLASFLGQLEITDEQVRQRTVDPLLALTGDHHASRLLARMKSVVAQHRKRIRVVHEEALSYLQHLVLVEGNDSDEVPSDAELAFWMLCVNCHLGEWAEPNQRELTTDEQLIAVTVRARCFNRHPHWMALTVRCYELFRACPEDVSLGGDDAWQRMQTETFGAPFETYFGTILMALFGASMSAGKGDGADQPIPAINVEYWRTTGADPSWVKARLDALAISREDAKREILAAPNAREASGLLHAPALLRRKPLIVDHDGWLITSPWNVAQQFHAGPWGAYLQRAKAVHGDARGFKRWSSAFGVAFERYCAGYAHYAKAAKRFRSGWRVLTPMDPGEADEIEDVVLIEDDHAVLFSVKSAMLREDAVHRAKSQQAVLEWFDRFLFSADPSFKGALRKLSANIDEIRAGEFEARQIGRNVKILPVLVVYDELGEDVFLYRHIRARSRELNMLQQPGVAPLTIASVDWYEALMEYASEGRSVVGLLRKRKPNRPWFDRRLDQQLYDVEPPIPVTRLRELYQAIYGDVVARLRAGTTPLADPALSAG
jgi:hypothetical protein